MKSKRKRARLDVFSEPDTTPVSAPVPDSPKVPLSDFEYINRVFDALAWTLRVIKSEEPFDLHVLECELRTLLEDPRPTKYYPDRILGYSRRGKMPYIQRMRFKAFDRLGGVCKRCSDDDRRGLQLDHVKGDGCETRKVLSDLDVYHKILRSPIPLTEYQILCARCNWIKRVLNGETKNGKCIRDPNGGFFPYDIGGPIYQPREYDCLLVPIESPTGTHAVKRTIRVLKRKVCER